MISDIIKIEFEKQIRSTFNGKDDLIRFFLKHPLREKCFEKVHSEITKIELKRPGLITDDMIRVLSGNFALMFCKQALFDKEQDIITESQKIKQQKEQDERKYNERMMNEAEIADNKDLE